MTSWSSPGARCEPPLGRVHGGGTSTACRCAKGAERGASAGRRQRRLLRQDAQGNLDPLQRAIRGDRRLRPSLFGYTQRTQEARQEGDYEAAPLSLDLAEEFLEAAERFVAAVEAMLDA